MAITILPPALLPPGATPPPASASDQAKQDWQYAQAQDRAYNWNAQASSDYLNYTFPNWLLNYEKTGDYTMVPPQPPLGLMVEIDSNNPWQPNYVQIGLPVCAIPPYNHILPPPVPGTFGIGVHISGNYWQVLPTDNEAAGYITPSPVTTPDGTTGIFEKIVYPFGGWYLKVG